MTPTPSLMALVVVLPLAGLVAQQPLRVALPVGTRVRVEQTGGASSEGTMLLSRGDTLLLQPTGRQDTIRIAAAAVKSLRVMESPPLWHYPTRNDINFYTFALIPQAQPGDSSEVDPFRHVLLVANQSEFTAVDPATGKTLWTRKDLPDLKGAALDLVGSTGYGVITRGDRMEILDLRTGDTRWDTRAVSLQEARGWLALPGEDVTLLLLGRTAQSPSTLVAVELATGKVRWRQDSLFIVEPKVFGVAGVSYLLGHQSPLADTDSTLVLYISSEGPLRLDARTGALLWRSGALRGAKVPAVRDGYARIRQRPGMIIVPSEKRLLALRTTDGSPAWDAPRIFKSEVIRMEWTRQGLLIRGSDWIDLIDPLTGKSTWPAPVPLKNSTRIVLRGDTVFVAADKKVLAIGGRDGAVRTLTTVKFQEGESPSGFSVLTEGIVLTSWHNIMLVDRQGVQRYHRVFPSPKESFGEAMRRAGIGTDTRRPATRWGGDHVYFFTGEPDEEGRQGFSLVEFDPAAGREQGRIWFDERVPDYLVDWASGTVYYERGSRELVGLTFGDWTALAYAARNGEAVLVGRLLDIGADVNAAGPRGWTALHYAASRGQLEVMRLLLRSGAAVDTKTDEGWTAWMLAAARARDAAMQLLQDAGALPSEATIALLRSWHLSDEGHISEALAAIEEAHATDSTLAFFPAAWGTLCWNGSVHGQAAQVMPACERAVERTPRANIDYASVRFARGLARALTGDLAGAVEDLESNLDAEAEADDGRLQEWIDALRAGRNPFTPEVLATLRRS